MVVRRRYLGVILVLVGALLIALCLLHVLRGIADFLDYAGILTGIALGLAGSALVATRSS